MQKKILPQTCLKVKCTYLEKGQTENTTSKAQQRCDHFDSEIHIIGKQLRTTTKYR